jgi:hypothetical protein
VRRTLLDELRGRGLVDGHTYAFDERHPVHGRKEHDQRHHGEEQGIRPHVVVKDPIRSIQEEPSRGRGRGIHFLGREKRKSVPAARLGSSTEKRNKIIIRAPGNSGINGHLRYWLEPQRLVLEIRLK